MAREAMKKGNTAEVSLISLNPYRMAKLPSNHLQYDLLGAETKNPKQKLIG